jgi:hypothetical protein
MKRDAIDFHSVPWEHRHIHARLENWSRYVSSGRGGSACAPMFRHYRSTDVWQNIEPAIPVDSLDGSAIEKAVGKLPEKHMVAVRWQYVYSFWGVSYWKVCRHLAVRPDTLQRLVHDGRTMLKNRAACAPLDAARQRV